MLGNLNKIFRSMLIILAIGLTGCEDSGSSDSSSSSSNITVNGSVVEDSSTSDSSLVQSTTTGTVTDVAGVCYIAAIPIVDGEDIYYTEIEDDGSFSFPIALSGDYIFKLLDENGLPQVEISFGEDDDSVFSVYSSTDLGEITICEADTEVTLGTLSGTAKADSSLVDEVVNEALKTIISTILTETGNGTAEEIDGVYTITLIVDEDSSGTNIVQERVIVKVESTPGEYGELDFVNNIEVEVAIVDEDGNDVGDATTIYTSSDYLDNDSENYACVSVEEIEKISSFIEELTEDGSTGSSDFDTIVTNVNNGTSIADAVKDAIDTDDYDTIIQDADEETADLLKGELESIEITTAPTKTSYEMGENLDITGLVVSGSYENGGTTKEELSITTSNISGFDNTTIGTQILTVTYEEKTTTFQVEVTSDATAPTVGNSGIITTASVSSSGFTLNWTAASDSVTESSLLEYQVVTTTTSSADITYSTAGTWTSNITTTTLSSLSDGTIYYYNVFVKDEEGNISSYTSGSVETTDATAPTVGNSGIITTASVSSSGFTLNWTAASDSVTESSLLEYQVVTTTTTSSADITYSTAGTWTANITTTTLSSLNDGTIYYYNVFVKDEEGNISSYTSGSVTTSDATAPTVGNSGTITTASVSSSGFTLNWTAATDNVTAQSSLQYKAVYSTSANISTATDAEDNGTDVGDWASNIVTIDVSSLSDGTTYYYNVFVKDEEGNVSSYTSGSVETTDATAPTVGNSGTISTASVSSSEFTLNWTAASDSVTESSLLEYQVVTTTTSSADITYSTAGTWTANLTTTTLSSLNDGTTYYYNVFVKDEEGNVSSYTSGSVETTDATAPTVGNSGTISTASVSSSGFTLNWTAASDSVTESSLLEYQVVTTTTSSADITYSTAGTWTSNITTTTLSSLSDGTTYYYNVFVKDEEGNISSYTSGSVETTDATAPTAGNSGTITSSNVSSSGFTLSWTAATDNVTAQSSLQYKAVYSTSANVSTATDAEDNGTDVGDWASNIVTIDVSSLSDGTTYYYNVLVKDEAGNISVYTSGSVETTDGTAPTVGNSGTITSSNVSSSGFTLSWTAASDSVTESSLLEYQVVTSTTSSDDITYSTDGTWTANITTTTLSGLTTDTTYYYNVFVKDEAGNISEYTVGNETPAYSWTTVGSAFSAGTASYIDMEFDSNDTPYAVYQDSENSYKATVMKYESGSWTTVGSEGFSSGSAYYTDIEFDSSDAPYVVFRDAGNSYGATVMKYDGSSWTTVGSAGFSSGSAYYTNIEFDSNDTPYVVYQDSGNDSKATVMKYENGAWTTVGTAGFSAGTAKYTDIEFDSNDTPYVVYRDKGNSYKATVMKFESGAWTTVGTAGFSAGSAEYIDMEFDSNDTPYVVYMDSGNDYKATVMKYESGAWATVGTVGFSSGDAYYTDIEFDSSDAPYVVFRDAGNSYGATVMKYDGSSWTTVGSAGFSSGSAYYTDIEFDSNDTPYVVYRDYENSSKATVMKYGE